MKRCPQCYEAYYDSEKFCELDGRALLADPTMSAGDVEPVRADASESQSPKADLGQSPHQREIWFVGTAGVLLGIVVCVGGYLAYGLLNDDSGSKENSAPAFAARNPEPMQLSSRPQAPRTEASVPAEEVASPEPEASPEPQPAPKEESNTVAARLNQGPVSTGQRKKNTEDSASVQTIIELNDGTAMEVDAAWEDGGGVWYRRGGMVAFVESQRVKAITG
ncbi:MAG TPA: hypothetical protein VJS64_16985, partial [Pyrinomonadaceae bacterium]|nr:hypothetical protein [Pyrinomonadaceae bacterium]